MLKDLSLNAVAIFSRLLAGVVLFVVMARVLGPARFGEFAFAMALASLLSFVAALGFNQQILRELPAHPDRAQRVVDEITSCKGRLMILVLAIALATIPFFGRRGVLLVLLTWVAVADSFSEYLFSILRAKANYGAEAVFMAVASLAHFAIATCYVVFYPGTGLEALAAVFVLTKTAQTVGAFVVFRTASETLRWSAPWPDQVKQLRAGLSYSVDVGVTTLNGQIDTILVKIMLGAHAAGVYQAGMRLVVGLGTFTSVAGNVFIPKLSAVRGEPAVFGRIARKSAALFAVLAVALGLLMLFGGWLLLQHGYGSQYAELATLLPWLAALLLTRVLAAHFGVQLTAMGFQAFRSRVNVFASVLLVVSLALGAQHLGLGGAIAALCGVALVILLTYAVRVHAVRGVWV